MSPARFHCATLLSVKGTQNYPFSSYKSPHCVVIVVVVVYIWNHHTLWWFDKGSCVYPITFYIEVFKSLVDKEVNIGQKAYDFPKVSQAAFENYCTILPHISSCIPSHSHYKKNLSVWWTHLHDSLIFKSYLWDHGKIICLLSNVYFFVH